MGFMSAVNATVAKNYLTTLFGILAGLPLLVAGSGIVLSPTWSHHLLVAAGIGTIGLGIVAKAFNVSSTAQQVQMATIKEDDAKEAAVIKAQVDAKDALKP